MEESCCASAESRCHAREADASGVLSCSLSDHGAPRRTSDHLIQRAVAVVGGGCSLLRLRLSLSFFQLVVGPGVTGSRCGSGSWRRDDWDSVTCARKAVEVAAVSVARGAHLL